MAKYIKREMPDLNGTGKTKAYYQVVTIRNLSQEEFIDKMKFHNSALSEGAIKAVLTDVSTELSRLLGMGYKVTLDGLGTFGLSIGLEEGKEMDYFDEDKTHNARSLRVRDITFQASKRLIEATDDECELERAEDSRLMTPTMDEKERIAAAQEFMKINTYMRVDDYARLTGQSKSQASRELRKLRQDPKSGITYTGSRSSLVYVLRK